MPENPQVTAEVVEKVKKGIEDIGALSKTNKEEIGKLHEQFKQVLEKQGDVDPVTQERLDKFSADLSTRQAAMDEQAANAKKITDELNKRMDEIEVAAKRIGQRGATGNAEEDRKLIEEYMGFKAAVLAGNQKSLNWRQRIELEKEPQFDELKEYKKAFNEYLHVDDKIISSEAAKALQVGVDVDGGYTVTPFMSNRISQRLFETDPIRQLASVETIGTDALELMGDDDEAGADWEGETVSTTDSTTPKMFKLRIPVHIMATRPRVTQMLLDDSNINIEAWLSNKVADKFARTEAAAFITGTGNGQPTGCGTYSAWSVAGTYERGKIEQVNSGHATLFTTDGLINLKYSMIEQYLNRGTFLTNRLNVRDIMKLKDGDGQYIWRPGITEGQPSMLLGLPFRMSTTVATTAASALAMYLADWREAYLIVDRQGINIQRDPYTAKPFIEFYTRKRVGGAVVNFQAIKIQKISA